MALVLVLIKIIKQLVNILNYHLKKQNAIGFLNLAEMCIGDFKECFSNVLAMFYYKKAAKLNCPYAYLRISDLYFLGNHFQKDYDKAISNYKSSAKLGNSTAYLYLGLVYNDGRGDKKKY